METLGALIAAVIAAGVMLVFFRAPELACVRPYAAGVVALRFAGALARYGIIIGYYGGRGDALRYHTAGVDLRNEALAGRWSGWATEHWSGTHALEMTNAVVGAPALGSVIGEFFLFTALGFVGLALCVIALRRSAPALPGRPVALVMLCWPSLVFWPSSIGKEAVILVSVGLMCVALADGSRRWGLVVLALVLGFAVRPHVAGLEGVGLFLFDTLSRQRRRGVVVVRLLVSAVVAGFIVVQGAEQLGVDPTELESVTTEIQYRSNNTDRGGSSLGGHAVGVAAVPIGLFNVLFRPLPFEANGLTMFIAAVEVALFWSMIFRSRRAVRRVLRQWRKLPFLLFGAGFGGLWATLIGLTFVNMGILARQRTLMMPFLVAVLALAMAVEERDRMGADAERRRRPQRQRVAPATRRRQGPGAPAVEDA